MFTRSNITFGTGVIIITIIILILLASLYIHLYKTRKASSIETFTNNTLDTSYVKSVYTKEGVTPCMILANTSAASSNYIDTMRIREWKPQNSDPFFADFSDSNATSSYCYFFKDDDKQILSTNTLDGYANIKDPLATVATCAKSDPLFKDSTIVTRMFESTGYDTSHSLPYKKCILELDKSQVTEETKKHFWGQFGENDEVFCQGIQNNLQSEIDAYAAKLADLSSKLEPYRTLYTSTTNLKNELDTCLNTNKTLTSDIATKNTQLQDLQTRISQTNTEMTSSIGALDTQMRNLYNQIQSKQGELLKLDNTFKQVLTKNIEKLGDDMTRISSARDKCLSDLYTIKSTSEAEQKILDVITANYRKLNDEFMMCEKLLREVTASLEQERPNLLDIIQKLENIKELLIKCNVDQQRLMEEENFWKKLVKVTQDDFNRCNSERGKVEARVASLKQSKDALLNEIEEIKKRCRDDQSNFNMATVTIHREAANNIMDTAKEMCKSSIAMRQRRVELLNEIDGILQEVNSCDRITTACKCYKFVQSVPWNDRGISGVRLDTTSGRIQAIRPPLDSGAQYVRFVHAGGERTGFYRLTKTRKKKGSGSYITVDLAVERRNGAPIQEVRMYQRV